MKRSLSVLTGFCLILMLSFVSCQKNSTVSASQSSQIQGKWIVKEGIGNYTNYGVSYKDTTRFTSADYLDFHADSTLTIFIEGGTYNGKWQITNGKLFITETNYMDYKNGFDLPILTNTDLQLYYTESRPDIYLEQKLNLYKASR